MNSQIDIKELLTNLLCDNAKALGDIYAKYARTTAYYVETSKERPLANHEIKAFINIRKAAAKEAIEYFKEISKNLEFPEEYKTPTSHKPGGYDKVQLYVDEKNGWFPNFFIIGAGQKTPTHDHADVVCASYTLKGKAVRELLFSPQAIAKYNRNNSTAYSILNPAYSRAKPLHGVTIVGQNSREDAHSVVNVSPFTDDYAILVHFYDAYSINHKTGRIESIITEGKKPNAVGKVFPHVSGIDKEQNIIESPTPTTIVPLSFYTQSDKTLSCMQPRMHGKFI